MNLNKLPEKTTNILLQEKEQLAQEIMALDGELTPDLERRLFANTQALAAKTDALQWSLARLENEEEFLKAQAKKLLDAAKFRATQIELLRNRVNNLMLEYGVELINGETTQFYITKAKPKLVGDGSPENFTKQTVLIEPDKDAIRKALEEGQTVDGYTLQESYALRTRIGLKKVT